jgi:SAM-dependent methyltransferase
MFGFGKKANAKLERLRSVLLPILKCVHCQSIELRLSSDTNIRCAACGFDYPVHKGTPVMMRDPSDAMGFQDEVVVSNPYTPQWLDIIYRTAPGLVLDFGSGNNPDMHPHVIKMDVFAMSHVDVVGTGEALPFRDDSFGAVMSGAVFEHVPDPFLCAKNLRRAMKPGAEIYIETAFLQPYHAYPHHYFNMTTRGVEKVFEAFEKKDVGVQPWQGPLFTLSWVLRRWTEMMPPDERAKFESTTVKAILEESASNPFSRKWLGSFGPKENEELASAVFFRGVKPPDQDPTEHR